MLLMPRTAGKRLARRAAVLMLGSVLFTSLGPAPSQAQVSSADSVLIRGFEDSLWATSRDRRVEAFATFLAPGYRGVYPDGVHDKARELATFADVHYRSYQLNDFIIQSARAGTVCGDVSGDCPRELSGLRPAR